MGDFSVLCREGKAACDLNLHCAPKVHCAAPSRCNRTRSTARAASAPSDGPDHFPHCRLAAP